MSERRISADQYAELQQLTAQLQLTKSSGFSVREVLDEARDQGIISRFNRRYRDLSFAAAERLIAWLRAVERNDPDLKRSNAHTT